MDEWFEEVRKPVTRDGIDDECKKFRRNSNYHIINDVTQTREYNAPASQVKLSNDIHTLPSQNQNNKSRTNKNNNKKSLRKCSQRDLDSLTKDLELLLEQDDDNNDSGDKNASCITNCLSFGKQPLLSQQVLFFDSFESDFETLLCESVGHCCSVIGCPPSSPKSSIVTIATFNDCLHEQHLQQKSDLRVLTPTPMHHDYLSSEKFTQKSNKVKSKQMRHSDTVKRSMLEEHTRSILSTSAINRFARFSNQFKEFSHKQIA